MKKDIFLHFLIYCQKIIFRAKEINIYGSKKSSINSV